MCTTFHSFMGALRVAIRDAWAALTAIQCAPHFGGRSPPGRVVIHMTVAISSVFTQLWHLRKARHMCATSGKEWCIGAQSADPSNGVRDEGFSRDRLAVRDPHVCFPSSAFRHLKHLILDGQSSCLYSSRGMSLDLGKNRTAAVQDKEEASTGWSSASSSREITTLTLLRRLTLFLNSRHGSHMDLFFFPVSGGTRSGVTEGHQESYPHDSIQERRE